MRYEPALNAERARLKAVSFVLAVKVLGPSWSDFYFKAANVDSDD